MKHEPTLQLQITGYEVFILAIKSAIIDYKAEKDARHEPLSLKDIRAIADIMALFNLNIRSGEILRHELKLILRRVYGNIFRFFYGYVFARRMEAIRNHPQFTREALRRGDALRAPEVTALLEQLAIERKAKSNLRDEVKLLEQEHNNTVLENEELTQQVEQLKKEVALLQQYIKSKNLPLPTTEPVLLKVPRCVSDSKLIYQSSKLALTLFPIPTETIPDSAPPSPISSSSQTSIRSLSSTNFSANGIYS